MSALTILLVAWTWFALGFWLAEWRAERRENRRLEALWRDEPGPYWPADYDGRVDW